MSSLMLKLFGLITKSARLRRMVLNRLKESALDFLREEDVSGKQERLLGSKLDKMKRTKMGKELGIDKASSIEDLPLTTYAFYEKYFLNPSPEAFMYPLDQYTKAITSGTTGKPKVYLLPKPFMMDFLRKEALPILLTVTHDGEEMTFEFGDTLYLNVAPAPYGSGLELESFKELIGRSRELINLVPDDPNLSFHEKVDYFIRNHQDIDIALMTITTLLDEVCSRISEPLKLKGFLTLDKSAVAFKKEIKEATGSYPKVIYGSTEFGTPTTPSVQYPGHFIFDWRTAYWEFLPEGSAIATEEPMAKADVELIPLGDVKVGKRYQLVATTFKSELTRYVTSDLLECVSMGDNIIETSLPVFKFYARADKLINLHNFTRIGEEELLEAFNNSGTPFVDFTARGELHGTREYLVVYVEPTKTIDVKMAEKEFHRQLYKIDKDYRDLSDFFGYTPLMLKVLRRGTFKRYLRGKRGMPKVDRVNMKEEHFKILLKKKVL